MLLHYRHKKLERLTYSPGASSHHTFVSTSRAKSRIFPANRYGHYTMWILGSHYAGAHTERWVLILRMPSQRATVSECLSAGYCSTASRQQCRQPLRDHFFLVSCLTVAAENNSSLVLWKHLWTVVTTDKLIRESCRDNEKLRDEAANLIVLIHSACTPITVTSGFFKHQL